MENELELWRKYDLHHTCKVVITHTSPGEELRVGANGPCEDDTQVSTYDITNMEEANQAVEEILSTANLREYVRQLDRKQKGLIEEVDNSLLNHLS